MTQKTITFPHFQVGNALPLVLIAGPCLLESRDHALKVADALGEMCQSLKLPFIFKTSFDKANRTSGKSPRGVSLAQALPIFDEIKTRYGCPVLTDVHLPSQCQEVAAVVDVLQIPAFLCRQTDLIVAAAATGRVLNIKKGQFLAPGDMIYVGEKAAEGGNTKIMLCERGVSFGYNTLVSDLRSLPLMARTGYPIIFDATHSVQQPGAAGGKSGGERQFVETLARGAVAVGVAGVFIETHPDPDQAPSDGPNMIPLGGLKPLLSTLMRLDALAKALPYQPFSAPSH
jgi:2-dehydro-3-deoxyphosphooctonate aldolase (KDO 8-P synthase)